MMLPGSGRTSSKVEEIVACTGRGQSMCGSWRGETHHLEFRWSDLEQPNSYRLSWIEEASTGEAEAAVPDLPDFAAHSPLGSGEWFVPWNSRWSIPGR
jgi:hypothetical protein